MTLQEWLSALTWRDGLDFFLLFVAVYGLLRASKGTRAAPVLVAVAMFGALAWVVRVLDLIALASILRYFFESIILVLIVVFQQELRRILLALGQRLLPAGRRRAAASAVGELVQGLERLQRARVGALVVLQGAFDVLEAARHRGIEVDAPLRASTLVALACPHPANAVHDGAIVVHDLRIERAGVICPLSEREAEPSFGTRHRAAMGVTEESDALAIVLSEQRGELRIAQDGLLSEPLGPAEVEQRIGTWLTRPRPAKASDSRADLRRVDASQPELKREGAAGDSLSAASTPTGPTTSSAAARRLETSTEDLRRDERREHVGRSVL